MCWWCVWGWPKEIRDVYDEAVADLGGDDSAMVWGPGHVVWGDANWDSAQWCLDNAFKDPGEYSEGDLDIVRESLEKLLLVPDEFKQTPAGYVEFGGYSKDADDPIDFPPPESWVMEKR